MAAIAAAGGELDAIEHVTAMRLDVTDGDAVTQALATVDPLDILFNCAGFVHHGTALDAKADECLRGAEILWTPEERDETLTMRDVLADYPGLRSV